jgi:hypothetical protein
MNKTLYCLILIIIIFPGLKAGAVIDSTLIDSSIISIRHISPDFFSDYMEDRDFNYKHDLDQKTNSILENLYLWIIKKFKLLPQAYNTISLIFKIIGWIIVAAIVIYGVSRFKFYKFFYTQNDPPKKEYFIEEHEENIENLQFAIQRELENRNFRKAVRFQFLNVLRELDEKGIINLSGEKTNFDYLFEIKKIDEIYASAFKILINIYNAVWYGHYNIEESDYEGLSLAFINFNSMTYAKAGD